MVMKRTKTPWISAEDFGRSLPRGVGLNLLVTQIAPAEEFLRVVLGARTIDADEDFAAIELLGSVLKRLDTVFAVCDHWLGGVSRARCALVGTAVFLQPFAYLVVRSIA